MKFWIALLFIVNGLLVSNANALVSPMAVSLIPQAELPPSGYTITGIRANLLWGEHQTVYGIDVGTLINTTTQSVGGIQVAGGANINRGTATIVGLQAAGGANLNTNKVYVLGVQAALYNSNLAESTIAGVQVGAINTSPHTKVIGLSVGLYNEALEVYGFQVGLYNKVESLHGIQIGLMNFNTHGLFAFAPIINIGF